MNVQNLRENHPFLISYLQKNGYAKTYINEFVIAIRRILSESCDTDFNSYEEYYKLLTSQGYSKSTLRNKRKIIGGIKQFDLYGIYPNPNHHYYLGRNPKYDSLSFEFKKLIDTFVKSATRRGIAESSITRLKISTVTFLIYLQEQSSSSLRDISEINVHSYFYNDGKRVRGYSIMKPIRAVFKECVSSYHNGECERILSFLPQIKKTHKIYPSLKDYEIDKIKSILISHDNTDISLRDKAIATIAFYTGLRACEISTLTFNNIDWKSDLIQVTQRKTGISLTLPLRPIVGNIVWKYLEEERPKTSIDNQLLFLTNDRNPRGLGRSAVYDIFKKILIKAGVRVNSESERKGSHLFRHNLAVSLLQNGVQSTIITSVLGHTSPESLESYLGSDLVHLKKCALSIEKYSIRKEAFKR